MLLELISEDTDTILLLAGISLAAFVISLILLPLIIIRLPEDYFVRMRSKSVQLSPQRLALKFLKNLLGVLLLLVGIVMLFIPGQGILTMLFGISLMDFPGKRRLQIRIVRMPRVNRSLNWLREKADQPHFVLPRVDTVKRDAH
jgi:hypothetical protein